MLMSVRRKIDVTQLQIVKIMMDLTLASVNQVMTVMALLTVNVSTQKN